MKDTQPTAAEPVYYEPTFKVLAAANYERFRFEMIELGPEYDGDTTITSINILQLKPQGNLKPDMTLELEEAKALARELVEFLAQNH